MQTEILENWFTYHAPSTEDLAAYDKVRKAALVFASVINEWVPDSADKTAAIRKVREATFTANAAITCKGK